MPNECGSTLQNKNYQNALEEDTETKILHQNAAFFKGRKTLCECLRQRNSSSRRISPIDEETDEQITNEWKATTRSSKVGCWNMKCCWNTCPNIEIFKSKTSIKFANSKNKVKTKTLTKIPKHHITTATATVNSTEHKAVQTVYNSLLRSPQCDNIQLYQYGNLMMSDNSNAYKSFADKCHSFKRKHRKFENFYWLLRPFRGKYRKSSKSAKIQAVVCKTYFVKWTKPPDPLINGFGIRRPIAQVAVLRRCRSAIF